MFLVKPFFSFFVAGGLLPGIVDSDAALLYEFDGSAYPVRSKRLGGWKGHKMACGLIRDRKGQSPYYGFLGFRSSKGPRCRISAAF